MDYIKFKSYTGKFIFSYVLAYIIIAVIYLFMQSRIVTFSSPALEFFQPYRPLSFKVIMAQIILGFIIAIVIYPLYENINQNKNRILIIFGLIWGLGLIGSLNPMPGSFEGLIYTEVTVFEHLVVLGLTALQIITFIWLFITWSNKSHNFVSNAVGLLEVVTQVLIFTWLFFKWMSKGEAVVLK